MSIEVSCPHCEAKMAAPENTVGKSAKCPRCKEKFIVTHKEDAKETQKDNWWDESHPATNVAVPSDKSNEQHVWQVPPRNGIIVSSGTICANYTVLGLVVAFSSKPEGFAGSLNFEDVYQTALERLKESAKSLGGNGLINVGFQNRIGSQAGCGGAKQVFEVFAWGTAIEF